VCIFDTMTLYFKCQINKSALPQTAFRLWWVLKRGGCLLRNFQIWIGIIDEKWCVAMLIFHGAIITVFYSFLIILDDRVP